MAVVRFIIFVLPLLLLPTPLFAQLSGLVVEADTRKPVGGVRVTVENTGVWTVTDNAGNFVLQYSSGETVVFSRVGLLEEKRTFLQPFSGKITVEMQVASVRIKEVTLTARKKHYSEIEIREEALKNIQAFSISDVLEQLPGQKLQDLRLNEFKPIVFRSVNPNAIAANGMEGFGNKSFGTAVVVDGIPVSNNENMQSYVGNYAPNSNSFLYQGSVFSPNTIGFGVANGYNGYFSNTNFGADLREIPVENIESVEVVQGIPSARYGDLTSGLVHIHQKSGSTPYRAYLAVREGTQEYNLNKGFKLTERIGFLNVNLNYLSSNSDPRTKFNNYQRLGTNLLWTVYGRNRNISNSLSVNYSNNLDDANFEAEDQTQKIVYNRKRDFMISNRFNWRLKTALADNLNVSASYSQGYQNTHESSIYNSGGEVVGTSLVEGVYLGTYSPVVYRQTKEVEGKPVSMFFSADVKKNLKTEKGWIHNFLVGISARGSDNRGAGRLGSPETIIAAFQGGGQAFRPYNFGENVRPEYQFSLFAENNMFKKFGEFVFNLNAGARLDRQAGTTILQPRLNSYLLWKDLKVRGGFGIASKAPGINMIYTGPRYFDMILADVRVPGVYNFGIVQTFIDYSDNKDLKPSRSNRTEVGLDYRLPFGNVSVTAYYNKLQDGFTNESFAAKRDLAQVTVQPDGTNTPAFQITGYDDYYFLQNRIVNALTSTDKGLEFMMNFNRLPVNNLSLDLNGSYVETTNNSGTDKYFRSTDLTKDEIYGLYRSFTSKYRQMMVGAALNYHLPGAGLLVTLRTQHFIVDDAFVHNPRLLYAYINTNLNMVELTQQQIDDPSQFAHIKTANVDEVNTSLDKVYHNMNLKISKDFRNGFKFSFYANNFLDLKQTETYFESGVYKVRPKGGLLDLSFGAKIEYEF